MLKCFAVGDAVVGKIKKIKDCVGKITQTGHKCPKCRIDVKWSVNTFTSVTTRGIDKMEAGGLKKQHMEANDIAQSDTSASSDSDQESENEENGASDEDNDGDELEQEDM